MENPHDTAGFDNLTEDQQQILLTEYSLPCHREALEIMRNTAGVALVWKLERSLAELRSK